MCWFPSHLIFAFACAISFSMQLRHVLLFRYFTDVVRFHFLCNFQKELLKMPKRTLDEMHGIATTSSRCYVAFFRALNVANSRIAMVDLRALFATLGATQVQSYIQTGNVVFHLPVDQVVEEFQSTLTVAINAALSAQQPPASSGAVKKKSASSRLKTSMTLRDLTEMRSLVGAFPFGATSGEEAVNLSKHHCMFFDKCCVTQAKLDSFPPTKIIKGSEELRVGPPAISPTTSDDVEERVKLGAGVSGSKISTKTVCKEALGLDPTTDEPTMRNWATVLKCTEMLESLVERLSEQNARLLSFSATRCSCFLLCVCIKTQSFTTT